MFDVQSLIRPHLRSMKPYVSARHDYRGEAVAWLDANENPFPADLNRYPDPDQQILKQTIARLKGVDPR